MAELEARIAALELARDSEGLSHEAQVRELIQAELRQKIRVRWIALGISMAGLTFMGSLLVWASHWYFWGKLVTVPSAVAVTMFLAPVVSITTIIVMLALGAFKIKNEDMQGHPATNLVAEGLRSMSTN
ncbi:MAG: hypothetical protein ACK4P4_02845 [Allorhizobium sp.]